MTAKQEQQLRAEALREQKRRGLNGPMRAWLRRRVLERWIKVADPRRVEEILQEVWP